MGRVEFMRALSGLLQDLSEADREEALRYYNDYFEDAGPEREEQVAKELGSPEEVARSIRADVNGERPGAGGFAGAGERPGAGGSAGAGGFAASGKMPGAGGFTDTGYRENPYHYTSEPPQKRTGHRGIGRVILVMLLVLFAAPLVIPLGLTAIALIGAVLVTLAAGIFAAAVSGIAIVFSGVIAVGSGIAKFVLYPAAGLLTCGAGLIVIGLGLLAAWAVWWLLAKTVPPFLNWLIRTLRRPFERRKEKI